MPGYLRSETGAGGHPELGDAAARTWGERVPASIRPLAEFPSKAVLEIERRSFSCPWGAADFARALSEPATVCLGLAAADELAGFAIGYVERRGFHLATLAVAPRQRRRGYGSLLLWACYAHARERGCVTCTLEMRISNQAAAALYSRHGFTVAGVRWGYYTRPVEDGVIMRLDLRTAPAPAC